MAAWAFGFVRVKNSEKLGETKPSAKYQVCETWLAGGETTIYMLSSSGRLRACASPPRMIWPMLVPNGSPAGLTITLTCCDAPGAIAPLVTPSLSHAASVLACQCSALPPLLVSVTD